MPTAIECLYQGERIDVDLAISLKRSGSSAAKTSGSFLCLECGEPVRPHRGGGHALAHFEHLSRNSDCSLSHRMRETERSVERHAECEPDRRNQALAAKGRAMNRKQFIMSHGATCQNWTWSWSFVNRNERFVIFGAWDIHANSTRALILSEDWELSRRGRRSLGYPQAREHIRLIEDEGYSLKIFPMKYSRSTEEDGLGPARIDGFTPLLTDKILLKVGRSWYASGERMDYTLPEELDPSEALIEGAAVTIPVSKYERNPEARARCIAHHGYTCRACGFDFQRVYGDLGKKYIHVHHVTPLSEVRHEREVDPINDLIPVCPNCHAMIHSTKPILSIAQLREHLTKI